ncbi:hypothetical protein [Flavobacterium aquidurense]|uniref:Uncharacterized protein n=1 Tax=Flavobacterium aquidurense TaxID=362413 RepID=A0A0Q0WX95_9FLAO|nr:hypothetical protein [Flavobacterium aquidurense]KQB40907.1 hypothetical protein RC62_4281 [Flavobacterium aquidurense]
MKSISQNKLIFFLKKYILVGLLLFTSTFIEIYWAVGKFSKNISSGCMDCSFIEEAILMSLLTTFFLTFLFLALSLIKNLYLKRTIELIILILVWLFWNHTVFVDRESSWSTYTFKEELFYTFSNSILPVLVVSTVTIIALNYISKSHEPN